MVKINTLCITILSRVNNTYWYTCFTTRVQSGSLSRHPFSHPPGLQLCTWPSTRGHPLSPLPLRVFKTISRKAAREQCPRSRYQKQELSQVSSAAEAAKGGGGGPSGPLTPAPPHSHRLPQPGRAYARSLTGHGSSRYGQERDGLLTAGNSAGQESCRQRW